ncbi:MAG: LOW QUALITY PROTEIN: hypothetical protein J3Q66DRAFT_330559 [Benniella sp.]|nr:MAG: LOW QUALITY PROTEIN: hypothetical protein J3Q66DRAFT_330559 [Benniella sp.]
MTSCPAKELFDIPELAEQVIQHLTRQELVQCIKTCKALHNQLKQYLFYHVKLKGRHPVPEELTKNRYHIRTLSVPCNEPVNLKAIAFGLPLRTPPQESKPKGEESTSSSSQESTAAAPNDPMPDPLRLLSSPSDKTMFHRLESISLVDISKVDRLSASTECFLQILDHSPHVTRLNLPSRALILKDLSMFLDSLANKTPSLRQLTFQESGNVTPEIGLRVLEICLKHPQLTSLRCGFSIGRCGYYGYPKIYDAATKQLIMDPTFDKLLQASEPTHQSSSESEMEPKPWTSRIEVLELPWISNGYPGKFFTNLFRSHLPQLKWIESADAGEIEQAFTQGCPKLEHVSTGDMADDRSDEYGAKAVIRGCAGQDGSRGLKSFHGCYFDDENYFCESRCVFSTVIDHHFATLETVKLSDCEAVDGLDLQNMFATCKKLKLFTIDTCDCGEGAIEFDSIVSQEWVCKDMEVLHLILGRRTEWVEDEDGAGEETDEDEDESEVEEDEDEWTRPPRESKAVRRVAQKAYAQIGRLTKLQELSLEWDRSEHPEADTKPFRFDMTLEHGWLVELGELKDLWHFGMRTDFWSRMGQAEVEFMHASWPKLEKLTFACNIQEVTSKPHWQWLKEKRPNLVFG